jgi:hypothetical protein
MRLMRPSALAGSVVFLVLTLSVVRPASAQQAPEKLPIAVVDVRGFYTGLGQDVVTASDLQVSSDQLPGRVFGGAVGVHVYPLRKGSFALGVGGEGVLAGGRAQRAETATAPAGPIVQQQLRGFSFQLSLNFGHRDGWSYLSAGTGPMKFASYLGETRPTDDPPRSSTINLGGGARWFFKSHLAFTFDIRFYQTRPENAFGAYAARARNQLMVMSGGISIR